MGDHSLHLGRIRGIDIAINWSWLIIFVLFTFSLAEFFYPTVYPDWSPGTRWIVAAISTVLLFVSVMIHELSHSFVAQAEGIPVSSITLFIFGGVSNIRREPPTARGELAMAAAGPAASLVIGVACYALLFVAGDALPSSIDGVLTALGFYNVALAIFNMIPGFPLDGGRVLRAVIWGLTGSFTTATNIAVTIGHIVAYIFIFGGLLLALSGAFLSGLWIAFIGWFLNTAASSSQRQAALESSLRGVTVGDVMRSPPIEVPYDASLRDVVDHYVLAENVRAVPVVADHDHLVGLVTVDEVRRFPRDEWTSIRAVDAMLPVDKLTTATPDEALIQALRDLSETDSDELPVVTNGDLVGVLTRNDVMRFIQVRNDLNGHGR
jgi:Zn-dependent protease/predicted transcriptional regulator